MKVGLVLEGGALRTIFSTGVLDAMLVRDLMPDYVVGVSAGIAYGVSYLSKQPRSDTVCQRPAVYGGEQPGEPQQPQLFWTGIFL